MLRLPIRVVRVAYRKLTSVTAGHFCTELVPLIMMTDSTINANITTSANQGRRPAFLIVLTPKRVIWLVSIFLGSIVGATLITRHLSSGENNIIQCSSMTMTATESTTTLLPSSSSSSDLNVRLPENIQPLYYKLDMIPFLENNDQNNFTLKGKVWIDVKCKLATNVITLHSRNLTIHRGSVSVTHIEKDGLPPATQNPASSSSSSSSSGYLKKDVGVVDHSFDLERDFYQISLAKTLIVGNLYRIYVEYTGILDDSLGGFYRSSYVDKEINATRYIAVTLFEPTNARQAFPCLDEPKLKATFEMSVARKWNMTSIANMPLVKTEPFIADTSSPSSDNMTGWVWDHYAKSVPMSTYLVAIMVSDFGNMTEFCRPGLEMRMWARKSALEQTEYAKQVGFKMLDYYEKFFGIPFPLPKIDMVALPDFSAGAMENWGLITFRETSLLYDPENTPAIQKLDIAITISHELAHQWFGNLVTPKWWNDLWLNEGFASYMEYKGVDHVHPDWKVIECFVHDKSQKAFMLDALETSHPISLPVNHPNDIFDKISYAKGATLVRMMTHFLTESSFQKGLHNYLTKWSYLATDQNDLWDSLMEQSHSDLSLDPAIKVADVMNTWTLQKGYPVIQVTRNYKDNTAIFTQSKFQISSSDSPAPSSSYRWWIPINYASKSENSRFDNTSPQFWLSKDQESMTTSVVADPSSWLIANVQYTGFYRVNYDLQNWQMISNQLYINPGAIHTLNRAQLLEDALNLPRANLLDYKVALNLTRYMKWEDEVIPWQILFTNLEFLRNLLSNSLARDPFRAFVRELVDKHYKRIGFTTSKKQENFWAGIFHLDIIKWACSMGNEDCVGKAVQMFKTWMDKSDPDEGNPIPADLRKIVYCEAIKRGNRQEWQFLWQRYVKSYVASDKKIMLQSLACSEDPWILNRYANWSISEGSGIRKQDGSDVLRSMAMEDVGSYVVFNFIREQWPHYQKYFHGGTLSMFDLLIYLPRKLNSRQQLIQLENLQSQYRDHLDITTRAVDQAIETVRNNVHWMEHHYQVVSSWLEDQQRH